MEPVKVPQHLELEDVVAWGLGAGDLLCVVMGAVSGWWLYLVLPDVLVPRLVVAGLPVLVGLAIGALRFGDLALRSWLAMAVEYALRPRLLLCAEER